MFEFTRRFLSLALSFCSGSLIVFDGVREMHFPRMSQLELIHSIILYDVYSSKKSVSALF